MSDRPHATTSPHDVGERRRAWLAQAQDYLVFEARPNGEPAEGPVRTALQSGCHVVQLREESLAPAEIVQAARGFRRLCDAYDALFIVNDRPDLALVCGADGVHIELADAHPAQVRRFVGEDLLIGLSTHNSADFDSALGDESI